MLLLTLSWHDDTAFRIGHFIEKGSRDASGSVTTT
jgi:hypothetical protein